MGEYVVAKSYKPIFLFAIKAEIKVLIEMTDDKLAGMTVNERLFHLDLIEEFDNAVLARDKKSLLKIFCKIEISETDALSNIERIFKNPSSYGYE